MIIRDYIVREILKTTSAVFLVLVLIVLSTQILRVLSTIAEGRFPAELLFYIVALMNLESMSLLLPLAVFLSVLLTLSRLYKDSEMIALASCGIGPLTLVKSVFIIALVFMIVESCLSLFISPWCNAQIELLKTDIESTADIEKIASGQFNVSSDSKRVLYTESIENGQLENVFLHFKRDEKRSVLAASNASIVKDNDNDTRYIIFQHGKRYDGTPGEKEYRRIEFKDYGILMPGSKGIHDISFDQDAMPTTQLLLLKSLRNTAELQWRISLAISVVLLALIAVPMSKTTPRKGRYAKMLLGILVYMVYSNLMAVARSGINKGTIPPEIGIWWVHLLFFTLFIIMLVKEMGWFNFSKAKKDEFDDLVENKL